MIDFSNNNVFLTLATENDPFPKPQHCLRLIPSEHCVQQIRRHKKRRINKKWEKKHGKKVIPSTTAYLYKGKHLIAHPKMLERLVKVATDTKAFKVFTMGVDFGVHDTTNYFNNLKDEENTE